tara:strand:- start:644 stop:1642 length:999 start_codon:yes stop_codon:yes gene_type:complete
MPSLAKLKKAEVQNTFAIALIKTGLKFNNYDKLSQGYEIRRKYDPYLIKLNLINKNIKKQLKRIKNKEYLYYSSRYELINYRSEAFIPNKQGISLYIKDQLKYLIKDRDVKLPDRSGFCYVLAIHEYPSWSKIGFTSNSVNNRAKDYSTQYGLKMFTYNLVGSDNAAALEKLAHQKLKSHIANYKNSKEIFKIPPDQCFSFINKLENECSNIVKSQQAIRMAIEYWRNIIQINKFSNQLQSHETRDKNIIKNNLIIQEKENIVDEKKRKEIEDTIRKIQSKIYYQKINKNFTNNFKNFLLFKLKILLKFMYNYWYPIILVSIILFLGFFKFS